jgi:ACS family hexuronate transporter-like MFS transporter
MSNPSANPTPRPASDEKPWRWVIIALLFFGTVINYIDRLAIPVLSPVLQKEFGLTNTQYGDINSWFLAFYAFSMFLWGAVFDRLGNRAGFSLAIVIWSLAEIGHAFAKGFASLCGMRALLGLGEAGNWPGVTRTIAAWFPARQRALAMGIANTGASLGPAIAPPLIIGIQLAYGWKAVFISTGILGFVWLVFWLALYPRARASNGAGPAAPAAKGANEHAAVPWGILLKQREVWGIVLARFFGDPIWWLYLNWMPLYLFNVRGFSLKEIAAFAWVPFVAAALGALSGGTVSGALMRRGWPALKARRLTIILGTLLLMSGFGTAFATSPYVALGLMSITLFGFQFWVSNVQTLPSDLFPVGAVGSIAGFSGTAAGLGAVIITFSTGRIVDNFSYTPVLVAAAILAPLATTVLFILLRRATPHTPAN